MHVTTPYASTIIASAHLLARRTKLRPIRVYAHAPEQLTFFLRAAAMGISAYTGFVVSSLRLSVLPRLPPASHHGVCSPHRGVYPFRVHPDHASSSLTDGHRDIFHPRLSGILSTRTPFPHSAGTVTLYAGLSPRKHP